LVSIPSLSGQEGELAEFLVCRMDEMGLRAHRDGAGNVVGESGDQAAGHIIALVGHIDTVPGHIPVERKGGALYGRGSVDAKGPLAAFVLAASRAAPRLRTARVLVAGTVGEEADGRGARHLARTVTAPYCTIIGEPSGWQGVTLGYKGMLSLAYRNAQPATHGAAMVPSPAEQSVALWNRLASYAETYNEDCARRFDTLDISLRDFHTFSDGLEESAEMKVSMRVPLQFEVSELEREMLAWQLDGKLTLDMGDPAFEGEKNTPVVRALLRAIRGEGGTPRFKLKTGTSDMNILGPAWGCPIVAYGPGDSALDHTPHEHIDLDEFMRGVDVLTGALELLGG
jgi:LysW-gamma-L-lysine carboxypeptidase